MGGAERVNPGVGLLRMSSLLGSDEESCRFRFWDSLVDWVDGIMFGS